MVVIILVIQLIKYFGKKMTNKKLINNPEDTHYITKVV